MEALNTQTMASDPAAELITNNLDLWTSAIQSKSASGRGSGKKIDLYGIKKLRELILELAVCGKLVPQDSNDEPASVLLERIEAEKAQLVKEKKIKKAKKLPDIALDEKPFDLPSNWEWVRLGSATNYGVCDKVEASDTTPDTWVLELEDVEKVTSKLLNRVRFEERQFKSSKNRFFAGDVIYGKLRPYLDKVLVADESGVCTTEMIPVRAYAGISAAFLRLIMKAPYFIRYANESTHGMNLPRMGTDKARAALIPVVPEEEQHRIVAKVDELMALCDQLEQQTDSSIDAHATLVEALLATLTNSSDTAELEHNWTRIADHFDTLFTTEHSIDQLKQTVLQLAVMGKLVPQDPNDEPASMLLERIDAEKARLVKEKAIKNPKKLPPIDADEKPFVLPEGWEWARLGNLSTDIHYGYTASAKNENEGVRLLRITDIQNDRVNWGTVPGCDIDEAKLANYLLQNDDILIARTGGTIGKSYLVENIDLNAVFASYLIRVKRIASMYAPFLKTYLGSQLYWAQLYDNASGTGQPNVNATALKSLAVSIPPLAEQHRIVAKVDQLMALCDQLKVQLKQSNETSCHLADAVVSEYVS